MNKFVDNLKFKLSKAVLFADQVSFLLVFFADQASYLADQASYLFFGNPRKHWLKAIKKKPLIILLINYYS